MSWKRAVFLGGAVLVLAACDNATAPTSPSSLTKLTKLGGAPVLSKKATTAGTIPAAADSTAVPPSGVSDQCSFVVIRSCEEPVLICVPTVIW